MGRERMVGVVGFGNLPIQGRLIVAVSAEHDTLAYLDLSGNFQTYVFDLFRT